MKTLYFDCSMGAAGDMLTGALVELFPDPDAVIRDLNGLGIPGVRFFKEPSVKCGITGTHMHVVVWDMEEDEPFHSGHHHPGLDDISRILGQIQVSTQVRQDILAVYQILAQVESQVHGTPVSQIHFHEVGMMDAVADITAVCYLLNRLDVDRIFSSPIHVGSGQTTCAHGILPVPAPATARILTGIPIYGGEIRGELCTPTGAALLKHFVSEFGNLPVLAPTAVGYGMGKKDFPAANCVRAILGTTPSSREQITELSCNLDDMTPEELGFAAERLWEAGALDVFTAPIGMKKNRPGTLLTVLCKPEQTETFVTLLFRHTTTLGIRENLRNRYTLERKTEVLNTPYGPVHQKISTGYGVERCKPEYEDLAKIARTRNVSLLSLKAQLNREKDS